MNQRVLQFLLLTACASLGWSFSPSRINKSSPPSALRDFNTHQPTKLFSFAFDDFSDANNNEEEDNGEDSDYSFMASLRQRMNQATERDTLLPLIVLDTMLPRQVLKLQVYNPTFLDLIRLRVADETPTFGLLGMARLATGEHVHLKYGVEVHIEGKPEVCVNAKDGKSGLKIELVAKRRFRIEGDVSQSPMGGWTEATVEFLDSSKQEADEENENLSSSSSSSKSSLSSSDSGTTATATSTDRLSLARAMSRARILTNPNANVKNNASLVDRWIELAKENEREPGQIDTLLEQLGKIPSADTPSERAFWVGALINPIPAMGVATEIRPALLTARTAEERVQIALNGILSSIQNMSEP